MPVDARFTELPLRDAVTMLSLTHPLGSGEAAQALDVLLPEADAEDLPRLMFLVEASSASEEVLARRQPELVALIRPVLAGQVAGDRSIAASLVCFVSDAAPLLQ